MAYNATTLSSFSQRFKHALPLTSTALGWGFYVTALASGIMGIGFSVVGAVAGATTGGIAGGLLGGAVLGTSMALFTGIGLAMNAVLPIALLVGAIEGTVSVVSYCIDNKDKSKPQQTSEKAKQTTSRHAPRPTILDNSLSPIAQNDNVAKDAFKRANDNSQKNSTPTRKREHKNTLKPRM